MIEARALTRRFGDFHAVREVSFEARSGEITGLLGPNGAGKTTTMRMLTGTLAPTHGTAIVAGHDVIDELMAVKRKIGFLPELPPVLPELTVREFLRFCGRLHEITGRILEARIDEVIDQLRCGTVAGRVIGNLSKGFRQRVGLMQAILHDPEVLVLDEPTVGLDPRQIIEIRELIRELAGDRCILLSSHILPEVQALCRRIVIIHEGRVVARGTQEELVADMGDDDRLLLRWKAPAEEGLRALQELDDAVELDEDDPGEGMLCRLSTTEDLREPIFAIARDRDWPHPRAAPSHLRSGEALRPPHHGREESPVKGIWVLMRKELQVYFVSPLAYVVMGVFLLLTGHSFSQLLLNFQRVDFYPVLIREMAKILLILIPILTMRLVAEERRMGSYTLLQTSPLTERQIVLGKFGATAFFLFVMIAPTAIYPLLLSRCGDPDPGPILAGYLGLGLLCLTFSAIGLFASSVGRTPVVSAVLATGISIALWMTSQFEEILGERLGSILSRLSLNAPMMDFCYGIVYSKHVILYLSLMTFFLVATTRMLRSDRWG